MREAAVCAAAIASAAVLLFLNTLHADLVYDDSRAVVNNLDLRAETPWRNLLANDFWGAPLAHSGSHKSFRPLTVATFRINYWLHALEPFGYHLVNVLLHAVVSVLVFVVSTFYVAERSAQVVCALLFALHPLHSEAVASVVGRAELLCAALVLLAVVAQRRRATLVAVCLAAAATFAKESGVAAFPLCAVAHLLNGLRTAAPDARRKETMWGGAVAQLSAGVGVASVRLWLADFRSPHFSPADNPVAHLASPFARLLTFLYLPVVNARLLVYPRQLSFDWPLDAVGGPVNCLLDRRNLESVLFYGALFCVGLKLLRQYSSTADAPPPESARSPSPRFDLNANQLPRTDGKIKWHEPAGVKRKHNSCSLRQCGNPVVRNGYRQKFTGAPLDLPLSEDETTKDAMLMGLLFLVVPFLPATNCLAYVGFVVAERVLYIPSIGFCLLVAVGFQRAKRSLWRDRSSLVLKCLFAASLTMAAAAMAHRTVQRNLDWLSEESLYRAGVQISPAKAYANLGNVLSKQGNLEQAEECYRRALTHRPNMADTHYNLGLLLQSMGRESAAIDAYQMAIQFRRSLAVAYLNLGMMHWARKDLDQAERVSDQLEFDLSDAGLKDPIGHTNARTSCLYNLGRLQSEQGRFAQAIATFEAAVRLATPSFSLTASLFNVLGEAHAAGGHLQTAEEWYLRALSVKPDHAAAYLTLGLLRSKQGRPTEARQAFLQATRVAPDDATVWQQLGQFHDGEGDREQALRAYERGWTLDDRHPSLAVSLGDLWRRLGDTVKAEVYYERAVQLDGSSADARANLAAILHVNKRYVAAEREYLRVLQMNPSDELTADNLRKLRNIVRGRRTAVY